MSGFKFKDLIFKSEDDDKEKKESPKKEEGVKFPEQNTALASKPASATKEAVAEESFFPDFPTANPVFEGSTPSAQTESEVPNACKPHIDKVLKMYEEGFAKLNQEGYDFFEYMQAVISGGINNPQVYQMAFNMGKGMIPTLTPETLRNQSEFYLQEIEKVYNHYVDQGNKHKSKLLQQKGSEEKQLRSDVERLEQEIARMQTELQTKQDTLGGIDKRYQEEITELDCKAQANQLARNKIVGKIEKVVDGLGNNVKS